MFASILVYFIRGLAHDGAFCFVLLMFILFVSFRLISNEKKCWLSFQTGRHNYLYLFLTVLVSLNMSQGSPKTGLHPPSTVLNIPTSEKCRLVRVLLGHKMPHLSEVTDSIIVHYFVQSFNAHMYA